MAVDPDRPQTAPPAPARRAAERTWLWVTLILAAVAVVARFGHPMQIAWLQNFLIVFGSLLVEATPFILLGAFVSAAIEVFVPTSTFAQLARAAPAAPAAGRRARRDRVPRLRMRLGAGRATAGAQGPRAVGGRHVHARRAHPEPGRRGLDVRRVSRPRLALGDGARTDGPGIPRRLSPSAGSSAPARKEDLLRGAPGRRRARRPTTSRAAAGSSPT